MANARLRKFLRFHGRKANNVDWMVGVQLLSAVCLCETSAGVVVVLGLQGSTAAADKPGCARDIAVKFFPPGSSSLVLGPSLRSNLAQAVLSLHAKSCPVYLYVCGEDILNHPVSRPCGRHHHDAYVHNYLIYTESAVVVPLVLDSLVRMPSWNSSARFVVSIGPSRNVRDDAVLVLDSLRRRGVVNAAVVVAEGEGDVESVFSWSPYDVHYRAVVVPLPCNASVGARSVIRLGQCSLLTRSRSDISPSIFAGKSSGKLRDLQGCLMTVAVFAQPPFMIKPPGFKHGYYEGVDYRLLNFTSKALNFTWKYVRRKTVPVPFENGSWPAGSVFHSLQSGDIDMVASGVPLQEALVRDFQPSAPYWADSLLWYVPNPRRVASWQLIFANLPPSFIVLVALVYVLAASATLLARPRARGAPVSDAMLACWSAMMEMAVPRWMNRPRSRTRPVLALILLYAIHINIAFKSAYFSALRGSVLERRVSTVEDLEASRLRIEVATDETSGLKTYLSVVDDLRSRGFDGVVARLGVCNHTGKSDRDKCFTRFMQYAGDYGLIASRSRTEFLKPLKFLDRSGQAFIHPLDEVIATNHISVYFRKGSPLVAPVNRVLETVVEGGLLVPWITLLDRAMKSYPGQENKTYVYPNEGPEPLSTEHFTGAYLILSIGLSASGVVFLLECLSY